MDQNGCEVARICYTRLSLIPQPAFCVSQTRLRVVTRSTKATGEAGALLDILQELDGDHIHLLSGCSQDTPLQSAMESSQEPISSPKSSVEVRGDESTELLNETGQDTFAGRDNSQGTETLSSQATPSDTWKQHGSLKQSTSTEIEQIAVDESRHRRHSQVSLLQSERNTGIGWHASTDQLIEMEDQASDSSDYPPQSTNAPQSASQWPRKKTRQGWRYGVVCAAAATCTVLLINVLFAIVTAAVLRGKPERWESGSAILLEGSSKQVHAWSIALHLIINGFSSVVLGGSNYTMQCLAAPSREEVDHAHEEGNTLDIGTQSIRNVFGRISWKRSVAWWMLAISSVPMHLLYNSTVFQTVNDNLYSMPYVSI